MDERTQTLKKALVNLAEQLKDGDAELGSQQFINKFGEKSATHTPVGSAFLDCRANGQVFIELTNIEEWAK